VVAVNTVSRAHNVDRLADSVFAALRTPSNTHYLPIDVYRTDEHVVLHADIPGVDPGSIDVSVDNNVMTIRAERTPRGREGAEWLARERTTGTVVRALSLGDEIDTTRITATYDNGVLTLTMPVAEKALPRRIRIQTASGEGQLTDTTSVKDTADAV
jgi:HSP20 family protein